MGADERVPSRPLAIRVVRWFVELITFAGLTWWGWTLGRDVITGIILAIVIPTIPGLLWTWTGTPGDPARPAPPRVAIAGPGRLLLELTILGVAAYAIWTSASRADAETFLTVAVVLYAVTWDRQLWLLRH